MPTLSVDSLQLRPHSLEALDLVHRGPEELESWDRAYTLRSNYTPAGKNVEEVPMVRNANGLSPG